MNGSNNDSSNWIKPNDVMQSRKLRAKRQALTDRLNNPKPFQNVVKKDKQLPFKGKPRNPFECPKVNSSFSKLDPENEFLGNSALKKKSDVSANEFSKYLRLLPESYSFVKDTAEKSWTKLLNVDWSLKSQVRICSPKPFQWKHTFKTSEEASGTTGFVRCLNSESEEEDKRTLDTSPNAQFYQRCLLWQHPSLPLVKLFPRYQEKLSGQTGMFGSDPQVASSLHKEWTESLRSLYQLLRVRQCPFFYVCCHSFTCLFRAAGAAGFPHTHALITPTTRGFRSAMKREGVEFFMPLHKANRGDEEKIAPEEEKDECEEEPNEFLETLGLETSQFPGLNQSRSKTENIKYHNIDNTPESLVYVEDMELQGLINFILNCGSCVSNTGALAGVPPTLLSPVGFHGGTLKSLKIYGGSVRTSRGDTQYCIDVQGPILPSTVLYLSSLLSSSSETFSFALSPLSSTLPFSSLSPSVMGSSMSMAFASEGLVDCGLSQELRQVICKSSDDLKDSGLPYTYKEIIFENGLYSWT